MKTIKRVIETDQVEPEPKKTMSDEELMLHLYPDPPPAIGYRVASRQGKQDRLEKTVIRLTARLREKVEHEIQAHHIWCGADCDSFLPESYREWRLVYCHSAEKVQSNYDCCHFR